MSTSLISEFGKISSGSLLTKKIMCGTVTLIPTNKVGISEEVMM